MTKRTLAPLAALFMLLLPLVAALPAEGQDWAGRGRVTGSVTNEAGEPIEGARVTLRVQGREDAGPDVITTNKKGRWGYLGLVGGPWTVVIEAEGYMPSEGSIRVNEYGANKPIDVTLREVPEEALVDEAAVAAKARLEKGNELLAAEDWAGARAEYEAALPDLDVQYHPDILLQIAATYQQEDRTDEAIATLERVVELDPGNVGALKLLASVLVAEGREEEAEVYLAQLPEGEALDADTYLNVGIDAFNTGDLEGAFTQFDRVVTAFPERAEGYYYRGLVLLSQGHNAEAKADFEKMLELDPDHEKASEAREFLEHIE